MSSLAPGVYPAAVTPFDARDRIDPEGLARLLAWFRAAGCAGVVVAGTTGEAPSLSAVEKRDLVREAVALGELPVIAGLATSSLSEAVWLARQAADAGAAAVLAMPPHFYREAAPEAIVAWFRALLEGSPLPVLLYQFPKRAGIDLTPQMVASLAEHPRLAGLKESEGRVERIPEYRAALPTGSLFMGAEGTLPEALGGGWQGTISALANVVPQWLVEQCRDGLANETVAMEVKHALLQPVRDAMRARSLPAAAKWALQRFGVLPSAATRLPLTPLSEEDAAPVADVLAGLGVLPRESVRG